MFSVCDRNSFDEVPSFIQQIQRAKGFSSSLLRVRSQRKQTDVENVPILVVGTQTDNPNRAVEQAEAIEL